MMNIIVLFDKGNQQREIALIKSWDLNHGLTYIGFDVKTKEEEIFDTAIIEENTLFIILIGESTRFLSKNFMGSLRQLMSSTKTILCLNLNGFIGLDESNCPRTLWDCGAIHMPFGSEEDFNYLLNIVKSDARLEQRTGSYHFRKHPRPYNAE